MKNLNNILLGITLILLGIIIFRDFFPGKSTAPSSKTIVKNIYNQEKIIHEIEPKIIAMKQKSADLSIISDSLRVFLSKVKSVKDTVAIIQVQDSLISVLTADNSAQHVTIYLQDSVISAQRYIIQAKDTLLTISVNDLKRVKKQRNWSLFGNAVLAGLLIIK